MMIGIGDYLRVELQARSGTFCMADKYGGAQAEFSVATLGGVNM